MISKQPRERERDIYIYTHTSRRDFDISGIYLQAGIFNDRPYWDRFRRLFARATRPPRQACTIALRFVKLQQVSHPFALLDFHSRSLVFLQVKDVVPPPSCSCPAIVPRLHLIRGPLAAISLSQR